MNMLYTSCLMSKYVPEVKVEVEVDCKTLPKSMFSAIGLPLGALEKSWIRLISSVFHCIFIQ